jgi:hypothetical protein
MTKDQSRVMWAMSHFSTGRTASDDVDDKSEWVLEVKSMVALELVVVLSTRMLGTRLEGLEPPTF